MTTKPIYAISISAQAVLDMHSLNNEGGEGNQIQTRMVNIADERGNLHNVNAISGDMFKHIQAEHLHRLAVQTGLPLSQGAKTFNANRVNYDIDARTDLAIELDSVKGDAASLDVILKRCAVTDMEGILVTAGKRSLPRKSVVEFGWVVGIPERVETDSFFHVKFVNDRSEDARAQAEGDESRGANVGQAIFHRPASSGSYAIVLNLEIARIGFNDLSQQYAINYDERCSRLRALLESVLYTFIEPSGAMRSTQNPHLVNLSGAITISHDVIPAPCISPIKDNFVSDIERVVDSLNNIRPESVEIKPFNSLGEFTEIMITIIRESDPFTLAVARS